MVLFSLLNVPPKLSFLTAQVKSPTLSRKPEIPQVAERSARRPSQASIRFALFGKTKFGRDDIPEVVTEVITFLEQIYTSVAENLPDVRDESWDGASTNGREDPYSLRLDTLYPQPTLPAERITKSKKHQRGVQICPGRSVADGCEERFLPAGTMKDNKKASFPTFFHQLFFFTSPFRACQVFRILFVPY